MRDAEYLADLAVLPSLRPTNSKGPHHQASDSKLAQYKELYALDLAMYSITTNFALLFISTAD